MIVRLEIKNGDLTNISKIKGDKKMEIWIGQILNPNLGEYAKLEPLGTKALVTNSNIPVNRDGNSYIPGKNLFSTINEAVINGFTEIILEKAITGNVTINGLGSISIECPHLRDKYAITGKLEFNNVSNVKLVDVTVKNNFSVTEDTSQMQGHTVLFRGCGNVYMEHCNIQATGSGSAVGTVETTQSLIINSCKMLGGTFKSGKTVGAIQLDYVISALLQNNLLDGSLYFNGGVQNAKVISNKLHVVDSSAISFAFKIDGEVDIKSNNIYGTVNNVLKLNGEGSIGTPTGVDLSQMKKFSFMYNKTTSLQSLMYIQPTPVTGSVNPVIDYNIILGTLNVNGGGLLPGLVVGTKNIASDQ